MSWLSGKRVVVPTDFSEASVKTLEWARTLVDSPQDLFVVHVAPADTGGDIGLREREYAEQMLAKLLEDEAYYGVRHRVMVGDAGSMIAEYAEKADAEMIILPSRGKTGLAHLLVGSVAERVLRLAHCPVLVLRD